MKRAVANLVDNAAEALHDSLMQQIVISTALTDSRDASKSWSPTPVTASPAR